MASSYPRVGNSLWPLLAFLLQGQASGKPEAYICQDLLAWVVTWVCIVLEDTSGRFTAVLISCFDLMSYLIDREATRQSPHSLSLRVSSVGTLEPNVLLAPLEDPIW